MRRDPKPLHKSRVQPHEFEEHTLVKGARTAYHTPTRRYAVTMVDDTEALCAMAELYRPYGSNNIDSGNYLSPAARRRALRDGFGRVAEMCKTFAEPILENVARNIEQPTFHYTSGGAEPDVAEALSGNPDHYLLLKPAVEPQNSHVHVTVTVEAHHHVTEDQHARVGAAILSCLMAIEASGRTVTLDIITGSATGTTPNGHLFMMPAKRDYGYLDIPRLAYLIGHREGVVAQAIASMYLAGKDYQVAKGRLYYNNSGSLWDLVQEERGDLHLATQNVPGETIEDATAWVEEQLTSVGIHLNKRGA